MKLFQNSLTWQMILATILGILCGLFFGEWCSIFAPWGSAYIMILKITTIPYLAFAIIQGIGQLNSSQALQILKKGLLFIALFWAINITMIYLAVFLFPQGSHGASLAAYASSKPPTINFAELLIPDNIFNALASNIIPSIVIFSLLLGISLMHIREKAPLMHMLDALVGALTKITGWISRITPIGTFLIMANQIGTIQFATIKQVSTYILLYIMCICILVFWIMPRLVSMLTNISTGRWIRDLFPILVLGYTTNVIIVSIPFIIELVKRELLRIRPTDEKMQSEIQGIVSIVFNLPLGSLFITIFIFFLSIFFSIPLGGAGQFQLFISSFLSSLGAVGLGSWLNSLSFILDTLGLPIEAVNIYLSTLPFTAGFQSMISVMEISSLALLITLACHKLLETPRIVRLVRKAVFTAGPVIALVFIIKTYNPLPRIENTKKSIYEVRSDYTISMDQYTTSAKPSPLLPQEDVLDKILRTKVLRVGCNLNTVPFTFCNNFGQIVGFDASFAYELAVNLGCRLELVPLNYHLIAEELDKGMYDIAMSGLSLTEERLTEMYFSPPYLEADYIFVTSEKFGKKYRGKEAISKHPEWRIAVLKGSAFECRAKNWFPNNPLVLLESYDSFADKAYETDVLLWARDEAISWIVRFPRFVIIKPDPSLGTDIFAYAIKYGSDRFLTYLQQWMNLKEINGFKTEQYNLWILGKTQAAEEVPPRWSILRDILHWSPPSN